MPSAISNNTPQLSPLDEIIVNHHTRIRSLERQVNDMQADLSSKIKDIMLSHNQTSKTQENLSKDISDLQEEVSKLKTSLKLATDLLLQTSRQRHSPQASLQGQHVIINNAPPTLCSKILVAILTVIALIAIALLVLCVVAACGGCPLFLSFLNMYTVGACISLPILACGSVVMLVLASLSINSIMSDHQLVLSLANS